MSDNKHTPSPHQAPAPAKPAEHHDEKAPPLPAQGSKDYVAGQPIDAEEQRKTEDEANAKRKAAEEAARRVEQAHNVADTSKK